MPNPNLTPARVVEIQLSALQRNDDPLPDAGILQTWAFAHPENKRLTGPIGRFAAMIRGPGFRFLINHRSHRIKPLVENADYAVYAVTVVSTDGPVVLYRWEVAKSAAGETAGSWMTTGVSPPVPVGEET